MKNCRRPNCPDDATMTKTKKSKKSNLEIVVLAFLFRLKIEASEPAKVLLADGLVDSGAAPDALAIVVRRVCPPVSLRLDIAKYHVLNWRWQAGHFPWDVRLPAAPCLAQMLQDGTCLVLLYAFWHHVEDVVHHLIRYQPVH